MTRDPGVPPRTAIRATRLLVPALAVLLAAGLTACSSDEPTSAGGGGGKIAVKAGESTCEVASGSLGAGTHTFAVTNTGTQITEFYVYAPGDRVMGEVENIGPSLTRDLTVELPAGDYETACKPGQVGKGIRSKLTVTGAHQQLSSDAKLAEAVASYQRYVRSQSAALIERCTEFVEAVKAGDIEKAKQLFAPSRGYWERIEPVAEIFGDLDPQIDGRENDVEPGKEFTGYHRIEKDLWVKGDVSGDGKLADKLLADVKKVVELANQTKLSPLQLANGSKELLDEVATGKITGEEDRYSHTDLWDFQANVEGSKAAIASLRPVLEERDPALVSLIDRRFEEVEAELAKHAKGDGFKLYTELTKPEIKALSDKVNALGEPVSKVAAVVAEK
jgi:iron uptake system component EfeO